MSAASLIARGRIAALALMVDACVITRVTGQSTNSQTGVVTDTVATLYTGKCRVQRMPSGGIARPATVAEAQLYQTPLTVQVPISVSGVIVDDLVTITASALDADLVGRQFWVKDPDGGSKTHTTMHRLGCEEVSG